MNILEDEVLDRPIIHQDIIDGAADGNDMDVVEKRLEHDLLVPPPIKYFSKYLYESGDSVDNEEDAEETEGEHYDDIEEEVRRRLREEGFDSSDGEWSDDSSGDDSDGDDVVEGDGDGEEEEEEEEEEESDYDSSERGSVNSNVYQVDSDDEPIVEGVPLTEEDRRAFEKERGTHIFATNFHPEQDWIAMGTITGEVVVYEYSHKGNELVTAMKLHDEGIRDVCFSDNGAFLFTVSGDRSIKAVKCSDWSLAWSVEDAHETSINKLIVCDDSMLATGDDDGIVKVWDLRWGKRQCVATFEEHADFISGFDYNPDMSLLFATSGDGSLSVYNVRTRKCVDISENKNYDFTAVCEMKNGEYIVTGTSEGTIAIFRFGIWANPVDAIKTTYGSVECMCFLTEDMVAVGFADGRVRTYSISPNRLVTVSAIHNEHVPVSHVSLARDGKYIATSGDDCFVKFWSVYHLLHCRLEDLIDENDNFKSAEQIEREQEERRKARMARVEDDSDDSSDENDIEDDDGDDSSGSGGNSSSSSSSSDDDESDTAVVMKKRKFIGPERKGAAQSKRRDVVMKRTLISDDSDADLLDSSSDESDDDGDDNDNSCEQLNTGLKRRKHHEETSSSADESGQQGQEDQEEMSDIEPITKHSQEKHPEKPASRPPPKKKRKRTFNSARKAFFAGLL